MAQAKKRVAARKTRSKRGKASAKLARKMAANHATPKKAKSKVQRAGVSAKKPAAKKKRPSGTTERRQVSKMPVGAAIVDEPATGVVAVTEHESVRTATSISPGIALERGEGIGPAGASA